MAIAETWFENPAVGRPVNQRLFDLDPLPTSLDGEATAEVLLQTPARTGERWTPSFGQVFVTAKVESGFMIQAAFGWPEVGWSPRLRSASSLVYASSGVRPLSDEWGRHRL